MKSVVFILIITGLLLSIGYVCADETQYPDLTGTWDRQYIIADSLEKEPVEIDEYVEGAATWIIMNQTGPVFDGKRVFSHVLTGEPKEGRFQGIVDDDGKRLFIIGDSSSIGLNLDFGDITTPDTLTIYHLGEGYTENNTFVDDPTAMKFLYKRVSNDTS